MPVLPTARFPDDPLSSASHGFAITPHATNPLEYVTRAIYVGGSGDITCRFRDSTTDVLLTGLLAGVVYDFSLSHVRATGTSAVNIVGLA